MNSPKNNLPDEPFDPDEDHPAEIDVLPEPDVDESDELIRRSPQ